MAQINMHRQFNKEGAILTDYYDGCDQPYELEKQAAQTTPSGERCGLWAPPRLPSSSYDKVGSPRLFGERI